MKPFKRSRSIAFLILFSLIFLVSGCGNADNLLPQPLYFIDGSDESAQVWRMEKLVSRAVKSRLRNMELMGSLFHPKME